MHTSSTSPALKSGMTHVSFLLDGINEGSAASCESRRIEQTLPLYVLMFRCYSAGYCLSVIDVCPAFSERPVLDA
jgi:hypothetical protein